MPITHPRKPHNWERSSAHHIMWLLVIALIFVLFTCSRMAAGAIINVPDPGNGINSIQDGIDAAISGVDEVVVAPGTYVENINLIGKAITLRSTDPADSSVVMSTIIDGGAAGSVITCSDSEGPDTVISGFVITNGLSSQGGGMLNNNSSPTVTRCVFINNTADRDYGHVAEGGAIYNSQNSPTITDCAFIANRAVAHDLVEWGSEVEVDGGAIFGYQSNMTLTNCTFVGNIAIAATAGNNFHASALGGAIYTLYSDVTLIGCTFTGNSAHAASADSAYIYGGAVCTILGGNIALTDCTFTGNSIYAEAPTVHERFGDAICSAWGCTLTLTNCTVKGNAPDPIYDTWTDGGGNVIDPYIAPPEPLPCEGDLTDSGAVDIEDVFLLLGYWGDIGGPGDINNDCTVDIEDVFLLLGQWGPCP